MREQRILPSRNLDVTCDEKLKSDTDQVRIGEEDGVLGKLIKKLTVVTRYETVQNKMFHTSLF
jgi:hypothetical protein